ncbi:MAG: beta-ketoacyl-ACP synthase II [Anaerolineales bacterium]|jgi:beta-ketoacyl-acyl-carrier-protein synthase II|nr:beta-ketoacyl-ACP synthase II [Anaerolineales bacterium]
MDKKRVVITGMGVVSALGTGLPAFWDGLVNGRSGIRRITQFDPSPYPCQIAGEVPDFVPENFMDRKEARRVPRSAQMGFAAAKLAVADSGLPTPLPEPERSGIVFGTAIGGMDRFDEGVRIIREQGYARLNPFTAPTSLPNASAYLISQEFQCLGPSITIGTACATGTQTVGEGLELIRRGAVDVAIVGGTEGIIQDFSIGGFCAMRALPTNYNDCPEKASRPFDKNREGFIFSEGAAALVLESLEHAQARGARIYAELAGQASSSDGFHMAAPDPEAAGPIRAMKWAIADAGLQPEDVDYINAHGTSTPLNDPTETRAIKAVFGEHAYKLSISSIKSMIGHAMGASGALEAIACAKMLSEGILTPTINYETPDPELDLDYIPNLARKQQVEVILSNSFGLGGQNACIVLKRFVAG